MKFSFNVQKIDGATAIIIREIQSIYILQACKFDQEHSHYSNLHRGQK